MAQTAATTDMEILRQKIKADKKLVVAENLKLTDAEGTVLARVPRVPEGPAGDQPAPDRGDPGVCRRVQQGAGHQRDGEEAPRRGAGDRRRRGEVEERLGAQVLAALPATKAARYIQIENKIRAAVRYELAAGIPLVE